MLNRNYRLAGERESFLKAIRFFSGIAYQSWGKLLTPLVNGLRVIGPFKPIWADQAARLRTTRSSSRGTPDSWPR